MSILKSLVEGSNMIPYRIILHNSGNALAERIRRNKDLKGFSKFDNGSAIELLTTRASSEYDDMTRWHTSYTRL